MRGRGRARAALLAGAALVASTGCGENRPYLTGLDVSDVTGAWVRIDPLPASVQYTATSDSVFFFDREATGPGRGMRRVTFREGGGAEEATNGHFAYGIADGELLLTYDCPPDADCLAGPHLRGRLDGATLTLSPPPVSSVSPSRYRRVSTSRPAVW